MLCLTNAPAPACSLLVTTNQRTPLLLSVSPLLVHTTNELDPDELMPATEPRNASYHDLRTRYASCHREYIIYLRSTKANLTRWLLASAIQRGLPGETSA